ncbi:DUF2066 domain-containing protein [Magnetococcales bacterium HHB-1]
MRFLFLFGLITLIFSLKVQEAVAAPSEYRVSDVEVIVKLPTDKNVDGRQVALKRAEVKAFTQLMQRMISMQDQQAHQAFLKDLSKNLRGLVSDALVHSEVRKTDGTGVIYRVEVVFHAAPLRARFNQQKIAYSESAYPPALVVLGDFSQESRVGLRVHHPLLTALKAEAKHWGLTLLFPLGDVDDLANLQWDALIAFDTTLSNWVTERYQTPFLWAMRFEFQSGEGQSGDYQASLEVSERRERRSPPKVRLQEQGRFDNILTARQKLSERLAHKLLETFVDRWILSNAVKPELSHQITVVVQHGFQFQRYDQLVSELKKLPGVTHFKVSRIESAQAWLTFQFHGEDERLEETLMRLTGLPRLERKMDTVVVRFP